MSDQQKTCKCGCGQSFITQVPKPNHDYIRGHKPLVVKAVSSRQQGLTREQAEPLVWIGITGKLEKEVALVAQQVITAQEECNKLDHNLVVLREAREVLTKQIEELLSRGEKIAQMINSAKELGA